MTRTAISSPLACYGLEYSARDPRCLECPHVDTCKTYMGSRLGRIPITRATFSLLQGTDNAKRAEEYDLCGEYVFAAEQVFKKRIIRLPTCLKDPEFRQILDANVKSLNCSIRMYLLTSMYAYKNEQPNRAFNPRFLIGTLAKSNVSQYRDATRSMFASFCEDSVEMLLSGKDDQHAEELFISSETQFASYIIGRKVRSSGKYLEDLYRALEFRLDPTWLATEPTYLENASDEVSSALRQHRYTSTRARVAMKRNKNLRMSIFRLREKIIPKVAENILSSLGFNAVDFLVKDEPITDVQRFWSRIGLTLQHIHCLRFLDGDPIHHGVLRNRVLSQRAPAT